MADLAEWPLLQVTRCVASASQEGRDASDNALVQRGTRRGDLLWLDRWAARASQQHNVPAKIHPTKRTESVVATQRCHRREIERLRPNASFRRRRGSSSEGRRSMEGRLLGTSWCGGSAGPGERPESQSQCPGHVSDAHKCEPVLHPLSDRKGEEDRDPGQAHRAVCGDAGPRRNLSPARSTIPRVIGLASQSR